MIVEFPYPELASLQIPASLSVTRLSLPQVEPRDSEEGVVQQALSAPIDTPPLAELAQGKRQVLIVVDDISRPTPIHRFLPLVLEELKAAGLGEENTENPGQRS